MTPIRLAALRLADSSTLYAKTEKDPVLLALRPTPPLEHAQIQRLCLASPSNPMMFEAVIDFDRFHDNTFEAEINAIEALPKLPNNGMRVCRRVVPGLVKRKRGYLAFDNKK